MYPFDSVRRRLQIKDPTHTFLDQEASAVPFFRRIRNLSGRVVQGSAPLLYPTSMRTLTTSRTQGSNTAAAPSQIPHSISDFRLTPALAAIYDPYRWSAAPSDDGVYKAFSAVAPRCCTRHTASSASSVGVGQRPRCCAHSAAITLDHFW